MNDNEDDRSRGLKHDYGFCENGCKNGISTRKLKTRLTQNMGRRLKITMSAVAFCTLESACVLLCGLLCIE